MTSQQFKANGKTIEIDNLDKCFYPKIDVTKGDVINYYQSVAQDMLPYLKNRPLILQRYPDGVAHEGFYQKQMQSHYPDWIESVKIALRSKKGTQYYPVCNNRAILIYLAGQGCITFHSWLSTVDDLDKPDKIIFDLDPVDEDFSKVIRAAKTIRDFFAQLHMTTYVMTTGKRGLHIWLPIRVEKNFDEVRELAKYAANMLAGQHPTLLTTEMQKKDRGKCIFVDYLRNSYGQTAVAPYSLRPTETASVAMPVDWSLLDQPGFKPQQFTLKNAKRYIEKHKNPWGGMGKSRIKIATLMQELDYKPLTS